MSFPSRALTEQHKLAKVLKAIHADKSGTEAEKEKVKPLRAAVEVIHLEPLRNLEVSMMDQDHRQSSVCCVNF